MNGSAWATAQAVLEHAAAEDPEMLPAVFGVAETRLHTKCSRSSAGSWMGQRGYVLHHSGAVATGAGGSALGPGGGVATSAGVAVAITKRWPSWRLKLSSPALSCGRAVLARVAHPRFRGGLVFGSVYLYDGTGWSDKNLELLSELGAVFRTIEAPFVIMGDWNLEGFDFLASGWAERLGAHVLRPGRSTCSSGGGAELDYMVASSVLCSAVEEVMVAEGAPVSPHSPVQLIMEELDDMRWVTVRRRRRFLPVRPPIGCSLPPRPAQWSWECGRPPADLSEAWKQWADNLEVAVLEAAAVPEQDRAPYRGRSGGYLLEKKRVRHVWRDQPQQTSSPALRTWAALLGYVRRAVAASIAGRRRELESIAWALQSRRRYAEAFADIGNLATLIVEGGADRLRVLGDSLAKRLAAMHQWAE